MGSVDLTIPAQAIITAVASSDINGFNASMLNYLTLVTGPTLNNDLLASVVDGLAREIEVLGSDMKKMNRVVAKNLTTSVETDVSSGNISISDTSAYRASTSGNNVAFLNTPLGQLLTETGSWFLKLKYSALVNGVTKPVTITLSQLYNKIGKVYANDGSGFIDYSSQRISVWVNIAPPSNNAVTWGFTFIQEDQSVPQVFVTNTFAYTFSSLVAGPLADLSSLPTDFDVQNEVSPTIIQNVVDDINGATPSPTSSLITCVQLYGKQAIQKVIPTEDTKPNFWNYLAQFGNLVVDNLPAIVGFASSLFGL